MTLRDEGMQILQEQISVHAAVRGDKKTFNCLFTVIPRLILASPVGNEKLPGSVLKSAFLNQSGSNTP
jgi:hypothetical protein